VGDRRGRSRIGRGHGVEHLECPALLRNARARAIQAHFQHASLVGHLRVRILSHLVTKHDLGQFFLEHVERRVGVFQRILHRGTVRLELFAQRRHLGAQRIQLAVVLAAHLVKGAPANRTLLLFRFAQTIAHAVELRLQVAKAR
jgi:hypothetical protein